MQLVASTKLMPRSDIPTKSGHLMSLLDANADENADGEPALSDRELMSLLDFFSVRIENALSTIQQRHGARTKEQRLTSALAGRLDLDERTLQEVLALLQSV